MKYELWHEKADEFTQLRQKSIERAEENAEAKEQLDDIARVVSQLAEESIESRLACIESAFEDERALIEDERNQIEAKRLELRAGITSDIEKLEQTIEVFRCAQQRSEYGKHLLKLQFVCRKTSLQLMQLLLELDDTDNVASGNRSIGLESRFTLIHEKANMLNVAGIHIQENSSDEKPKVLSMSEEERRRRGQAYVDRIIGVYMDNLLDFGATPGKAMAKLRSELKTWYLSELEKELAGKANELYIDPDYNQLLARIRNEEPVCSGKEGKDVKEKASATNSLERQTLSPEEDNVFLRAQSAIDRSLLSMFPPRRAEVIDSGYTKASPNVIRLINRYVGEFRGITNTRNKSDTCHYNPATHTIAMNEQKNAKNNYLMTQHEYVDIFKHEMGHFIDHVLGSVSGRAEYLSAMEDDLKAFSNTYSMGEENLKNMLDDLYSTGDCYDRNVTDIISALFNNKRSILDRFDREGVAFFWHEDDYWDAKDVFGRDLNLRGKEIFANCFAIESDGYRISKNFLERWFPKINERMTEIIKGDWNGTS